MLPNKHWEIELQTVAAFDLCCPNEKKFTMRPGSFISSLYLPFIYSNLLEGRFSCLIPEQTCPLNLTFIRYRNARTGVIVSLPPYTEAEVSQWWLHKVLRWALTVLTLRPEIYKTRQPFWIPWGREFCSVANLAVTWRITGTNQFRCAKFTVESFRRFGPVMRALEFRSLRKHIILSVASLPDYFQC